MDWIKRNLYFFIGSVVALLLMGLAGFYLFTKWQLNSATMEKLNAEYAELQRLNSESPHPGSGDVDNIAEAKKQQQQLQGVAVKTREHFQPIPSIPSETPITSQNYANSLRRTIDQLQKAATNASVALPPGYYFSFEAQKPRMTFAAGSLEPLAAQLGEIKALCEILITAKINSIENIRRERVSPDDSSGPTTDYFEKKSTTNELAVIAPYEITFRCFSAELAAVLGGVAASPHGFIVKTINVEPAPASEFSTLENPAAGVTPGYPPAGYVPPQPARPNLAEGAEFARRYGLGPEGPGGPSGGVGIPLRMPGAPGYAPQPAAPAYPTYGAAPAGGAPRGGGLPTVLDEKVLKITMEVDVVKLLPTNKKDGKAAPVAATPAT